MSLCHNPSCPKPASLLCTRCRQVYYCSRECQKADYPLHKQKCISLSPSLAVLPSVLQGVVAPPSAPGTSAASAAASSASAGIFPPPSSLAQFSSNESHLFDILKKELIRYIEIDFLLSECLTQWDKADPIYACALGSRAFEKILELLGYTVICIGQVPAYYYEACLIKKVHIKAKISSLKDIKGPLPPNANLLLFSPPPICVNEFYDVDVIMQRHTWKNILVFYGLDIDTHSKGNFISSFQAWVTHQQEYEKIIFQKLEYFASDYKPPATVCLLRRRAATPKVLKPFQEPGVSSLPPLPRGISTEENEVLAWLDTSEALNMLKVFLGEKELPHFFSTLKRILPFVPPMIYKASFKSIFKALQYGDKKVPFYSVGSGTGALEKIMELLGFTVVCIDPYPGMWPVDMPIIRSPNYALLRDCLPIERDANLMLSFPFPGSSIYYPIEAIRTHSWKNIFILMDTSAKLQSAVNASKEGYAFHKWVDTQTQYKEEFSDAREAPHMNTMWTFRTRWLSAKPVEGASACAPP